MHYRYIPILKWKRGERRAIKAVTPEIATGVCPLITLTEETFKDQPETATSESIPASLLFADEIYKHWGSRPFFLNASMIQASAGGIHPLIDTAERCRRLGAKLTPATPLTPSAAYEAAVSNVTQTDNRGVALSVTLAEFTRAAQWLPSWPHALNQTDLILDLADKVAMIADLGSVLEMAFRSLPRGIEWRSVTVAGTSMPANFITFDKDAIHLIDRKEWTLWQHLISLSLPYRLDYGDYATTAAIMLPPPDLSWGFPINVRYTLPTEFLVCRGVRTRGEGARDLEKQLIAHATVIERYGRRSRLSCWADETIDKIAAMEQKPEGLEHWVRIAVNRHITRVRTDMP